MDVQLQELIDKIKRDGVASAESEAQDIISEAQKKAASIIKDAEEKAEGIIKNARTETQRMEKASEDAIAQAGRNLLISFRDGINRELSALISSESAKSFDKDMLKKLIPETVKAWASQPSVNDLTVLLPAKDLKTLETGFMASLKAQISKGMEIKADDSLSNGFRIGAKDGSAFYDFSAEEVAGLFSSYLNPRTTELMKRAAAGLDPEESTEAEPEKKAPARKTTAKKTATAKTGAAKGTK